MPVLAALKLSFWRCDPRHWICDSAMGFNRRKLDADRKAKADAEANAKAEPAARTTAPSPPQNGSMRLSLT